MARLIRQAQGHNELHQTMKDKVGILGEVWEFLRFRKKWWLTPIVVLIILLGAILVFAQTSALGPFIYTMF